MNYYNRFDFGVPLEDISPQNDIHPRLKHLFHQAYKHTLNDTDIGDILKDSQGSLEYCFHLKEKLVFEVPCNLSDYESPGSYFWLIRHFLGLLPIPLSPNYHQNFSYNWKNLGKKCQMVLSCDKYDVNVKYKVDSCIAKCIDTLPTEHFLLLTILVNFIRRIAFRFGVLHKHNFVCLAKYYCGSVFIRPYRPGDRNDRKMLPMFFYLLTKWNNITKKCKRHVTFSEITSSYQLKKHASCQADFVDENYNNKLENSMNIFQSNDTCSHTDLWKIPKKTCSIHKSCQTELTETINSYCQTETNFEDSESIIPIANSSVIDNPDNQHSEKYYTALFHDTLHNDPSICSAIDDDVSVERDPVNFLCTIESKNLDGWNDIMRETENTVKKIEEYIYDDYETFRWEDYNQISIEKRSMSTFKDNYKQSVWTENTPRSLIYRENDENSSFISALISNKTYFKFPDVISDDDCTEFSYSGTENTAGTNCSALISKSCDHLNQLSYNIENNPEGRCEKSKIKFNLKRFRMSFAFLRSFIPKRNYRTTYQDIVSNVRYKKIVNHKASTL